MPFGNVEKKKAAYDFRGGFTLVAGAMLPSILPFFSSKRAILSRARTKM